jgi:hypothetical protein
MFAMNDQLSSIAPDSVQTRDPIDVIAGIERQNKRSRPAGQELKTAFEVAWELAH